MRLEGLGKDLESTVSHGKRVGLKITKMAPEEIGSQLKRLVIFRSRVDRACPGLLLWRKQKWGSS